jgi:hypothetical protein
LREVKSRGRSVSVDGIYAILGLLPYGKDVKVEYKPNICEQCPEKIESENCDHNKEYKK